MVSLNKEDDRRALEIHKNAFVADLHSDLQIDLVTRRALGEKKILERIHLQNLREGGVDFIILSTISKYSYSHYPYYQTPYKCALDMIDTVYQEQDESPDNFQVVTDARSLEDARRNGRIGLLLGMEGAEPIELDLGLLRCFYKLGVRLIQPNWHQRNLIADGGLETSNAGFSNFGREAVKEMERLGMIMDISHLGENAFWELFELTERPIIASHANAKTIHDHPRNLTDDQIESIAKRGGIIGSVFISRFTGTPDSAIDELMKHVNHVEKLVGVDHMGIGPDWIDYAKDLLYVGSYDVLPPGFLPKREDFMIRNNYVRDLETVRQLPNLTKALVAHGYSEGDIRKILGENFVRFFKEFIGR